MTTGGEAESILVGWPGTCFYGQAMTSVEQLMATKGRVVHTISDQAPVFEAISKMAAEDIGSVVVVRDGSPCGILTERDYVRRVVLEGRSPEAILVREVMSSDLIAVRTDTDVVVCMALMTEKRMRHLPVLDEGTLVGMISMGDIVKHLARQSNVAIEELTRYIRGS